MQRLDGGPFEDKRWITTRQCPSVPSPNSRAKKDQTMDVPSYPKSPSTSPWPGQSHIGLQTTKPRPVFSPSPHTSFKRSLPNSTSEMHLVPSNSDLLIGSLNQRDQYTMETPLNNPMETDLPPPPPQVSSGRLGAIIVVYVPCPLRASSRLFAFARIKELEIALFLRQAIIY